MRAVVCSSSWFLLLSLAAIVCHGLDPSQCSSEDRALSSDYIQCPSLGDDVFFDVIKTKCVETCGKEEEDKMDSCGESCVLQTVIASCEGREKQKKWALRTSCERLMEGAAKATGGCEQFVEECVAGAEASGAAKTKGQGSRSDDSEIRDSDDMTKHPLFLRSVRRFKRADCNAIKTVSPTKKCSDHCYEFLGEVEVLCEEVCKTNEDIDKTCANMCFMKQLTDNCPGADVTRIFKLCAATITGSDPNKCENWIGSCLDKFSMTDETRKCDHGDKQVSIQAKCQTASVPFESRNLCIKACQKPDDNDNCLKKCFLNNIVKKCIEADKEIGYACPDTMTVFLEDRRKCSHLQDKCVGEYFEKNRHMIKCDFPNPSSIMVEYRNGDDMREHLKKVEKACQENADCFIDALVKADNEYLVRRACRKEAEEFTKKYECHTLQTCYKNYQKHQTTTVKTTVSRRITSITDKSDQSTKTSTTTTTATAPKEQKSNEKEKKEVKKEEEDREANRKKDVIVTMIWIRGIIATGALTYLTLHLCDKHNWCRRRRR